MELDGWLLLPSIIYKFSHAFHMNYKKATTANNTTTQHEMSHDLAVAIPAMVFSLNRFLFN